MVTYSVSKQCDTVNLFLLCLGTGLGGGDGLGRAADGRQM